MYIRSSLWVGGSKVWTLCPNSLYNVHCWIPAYFGFLLPAPNKAKFTLNNPKMTLNLHEQIVCKFSDLPGLKNWPLLMCWCQHVWAYKKFGTFTCTCPNASIWSHCLTRISTLYTIIFVLKFSAAWLPNELISDRYLLARPSNKVKIYRNIFD